jgi:hypothetical protein
LNSKSKKRDLAEKNMGAFGNSLKKNSKKNINAFV